MITQVTHEEAWMLHLIREPGDGGWPDEMPVPGTRAGRIRPTSISARLIGAETCPRMISVHGERGNGLHAIPQTVQYGWEIVPAWAREAVTRGCARLRGTSREPEERDDHARRRA
jgi:hypothetical protein